MRYLRALKKNALKMLAGGCPGFEVRIRLPRKCGCPIGRDVHTGEDLVEDL